MKRLFKSTLVYVTVLLSLATIVSCGGDEDKLISNEENTINNNENGNEVIVDDIDISLLRGEYVFNGNIAPSFVLYKDGTCEINYEAGEWKYDKKSHLLSVGKYFFTIKMLSKESLVAEWTSLEYGKSVSSWTRNELPDGIDDGIPSKPEQTHQNYEKLNGHEYVEINGIKWSVMNLGATTIAGSPSTCYGNYYARGETRPRYSRISFSNIQEASISGWSFANGYSSTLPSYTGKTLDSAHDAATANWGSDWHTPTLRDFGSLKAACITNTAVSIKNLPWLTTSSPSGGIYWLRLSQPYLPEYRGVAGVLFVDKSDTSKRVFFPASGTILKKTFCNGGWQGSYWSADSAPTPINTGFCYNLGHDLSYNTVEYFVGNSIRPVSK